MSAWDTSGPARTVSRHEQVGARQVLKANAGVQHMSRPKVSRFSTPIAGKSDADRTARIAGKGAAL